MSRVLRVTSTVLVAMSSTPFPMHEVNALPLSQLTTDGVVIPRPDTALRNRGSTKGGNLTTSKTIYALSDHRIVKISESRSSVLKVIQNSAAKLAVRKSAHEQPERTVKSARGAPKPAKPANRSKSLSGVESTHGNRGLALAKTALSLVGRPYRWGGDSLAGFDCSGLIQYIYLRLGIHIPRTSYAQFTVGQPVSWNSLHPGDLVFFQTDAKGASHVAIYVGRGLIVQALNPRTGVIVSHLNDSYYRSRFIGARRPY